MQCGRYGTHAKNTMASCRDCNVAPEDADNPEAKCTFITQAQMQDLVDNRDMDGLHNLSHHWVQNAWHRVCFGGDPHGIHGMTPPEPLHFLQLGWLATAITGFHVRCTDTTKQKIDDFVKVFAVSLKHQSEHDFPTLNFPRGITSLKLVKAYEHVGIMLMLVLALHCKTFLEIFEDGGKLLKSGDHSIDCLKARHFRNLFEMLLCHHEWMRLTSML